MILIIFCLFTFFNCFQRIAFSFGFESFETLDENEEDLKSMEGKRIIILNMKQNNEEISSFNKIYTTESVSSIDFLNKDPFMYKKIEEKISI